MFLHTAKPLDFESMTAPIMDAARGASLPVTRESRPAGNIVAQLVGTTAAAITEIYVASGTHNGLPIDYPVTILKAPNKQVLVVPTGWDSCAAITAPRGYFNDSHMLRLLELRRLNGRTFVTTTIPAATFALAHQMFVAIQQHLIPLPGTTGVAHYDGEKYNQRSINQVIELGYFIANGAQVRYSNVLQHERSPGELYTYEF